MEEHYEQLSDKELKRLKRLTKVLINEVGESNSSKIARIATGKLKRFGSTDLKNAPLFMPIDVVMQLEAHASTPHLTIALAEHTGSRLAVDAKNDGQRKSEIKDVVTCLKLELASLTAAHTETGSRTDTSEKRHAKLLDAMNRFQHYLIEIKLILGAK